MVYKEADSIRDFQLSATRHVGHRNSVSDKKELKLISLLSHRLQAIPESKRRCVNPDYSGLPGVSVSCTKKHLARNKPE